MIKLGNGVVGHVCRRHGHLLDEMVEIGDAIEQYGEGANAQRSGRQRLGVCWYTQVLKRLSLITHLRQRLVELFDLTLFIVSR